MKCAPPTGSACNDDKIRSFSLGSTITLHSLSPVDRCIRTPSQTVKDSAFSRILRFSFFQTAFWILLHLHICEDRLKFAPNVRHVYYWSSGSHVAYTGTATFLYEPSWTVVTLTSIASHNYVTRHKLLQHDRDPVQLQLMKACIGHLPSVL